MIAPHLSDVLLHVTQIHTRLACLPATIQRVTFKATKFINVADRLVAAFWEATPITLPYVMSVNQSMPIKSTNKKKVCDLIRFREKFLTSSYRCFISQ